MLIFSAQKLCPGKERIAASAGMTALGGAW